MPLKGILCIIILGVIPPTVLSQNFEKGGVSLKKNKSIVMKNKDDTKSGDEEIHKFHLRVAVEEWIPHVKVDETPDGDITISGPLANLLESLATSLNFKYTLVRPSDGAWGIPVSDGSWNGMIGMVKRNEADLALGPFGLTFSRSRVVEFSSPIIIDYYRILFRRPQPETDPWTFSSPFRNEVWFGALVSVVIITSSLMVIWVSVGNVIGIKDGEENARCPGLQPTSFLGHLWSVVGSAMTQPITWSINSSSGRIIIAVWWVTVVVMTKSYSSSLTSLLAVRTIHPKYEFLTDLVEDKDVDLIFEKATALVEHFSKVKSGIYRDLADTIDEGRSHFLASSLLFDAAYNEVKNGKHVLLVEDTTCRKIYSDDFTKFGKCNFYLGKQKYWPLIFCLIGKKNQPLMKSVNERLDRMAAHDLYFKWLSDEVPNATACLKASKKVTVREPYHLDGLWGVFAVFGGGIITGLVCFAIEFWHRKTKSFQ